MDMEAEQVDLPRTIQIQIQNQNQTLPKNTQPGPDGVADNPSVKSLVRIPAKDEKVSHLSPTPLSDKWIRKLLNPAKDEKLLFPKMKFVMSLLLWALLSKPRLRPMN